MDTNNNQDATDPPPMIRSKTFDVIETKLTNLPVVEGESGSSESSSRLSDRIVTVNIEGKSLTEFLSHAKDGLLMSRPGTRYGRSDSTYGAAASSRGDDHLLQPQKDEGSGDLLVYIKLPDDSLLLASSPRDRTLGQLLEVVAGTQVGGQRLLIADDGLEDEDLVKTLLELGITDNTTLHLMFLHHH